MDWGIDFRFLLINPSLLFALFTILSMCGFQERLLDMSMPRCVATGIVLSGSSCIVYGLSTGDLDLVMCNISHLEGLKVICQVYSQSFSLSKSCCMLSWSVWLLAKSLREGPGEIWEGMSFILRRKRRGPRAVPCGTLELTCN